VEVFWNASVGECRYGRWVRSERGDAELRRQRGVSLRDGGVGVFGGVVDGGQEIDGTKLRSWKCFGMLRLESVDIGAGFVWNAETRGFFEGWGSGIA